MSDSAYCRIGMIAIINYMRRQKKKRSTAHFFLVLFSTLKFMSGNF